MEPTRALAMDTIPEPIPAVDDGAGVGSALAALVDDPPVGAQLPTEIPLPPKRGPGRPKGAKNKPKGPNQTLELVHANADKLDPSVLLSVYNDAMGTDYTATHGAAAINAQPVQLPQPREYLTALNKSTKSKYILLRMSRNAKILGGVCLALAAFGAYRLNRSITGWLSGGSKVAATAARSVVPVTPLSSPVSAGIEVTQEMMEYAASALPQ